MVCFTICVGLPSALLILLALLPPATALSAALLGSAALIVGCCVGLCGELYGRSVHDRFERGSYAHCFARWSTGFEMLGFLALVALTIRHGLAGFWWTALIVWPLTLCFCGGFFFLFRQFNKQHSLDRRQEAIWAEEQREARQFVLQRTIVFEGSVLPGVGRPCVCCQTAVGSAFERFGDVIVVAECNA